jgi:hypothetical protein
MKNSIVSNLKNELVLLLFLSMRKLTLGYCIFLELWCRETPFQILEA